MAQVPTGTIFSIASVLAAAKTVSAVSNAAEAVVTCTAHGYAAGDYVLITSGWGRLNLRAARVKAPVNANDFVLEGMDTSSTNFFPAGSGGGTVAKITTWAQIQQVMNPQSSGGDPKNVTYKYTESDVENTINDGFSATNYTMELDADAIGTAGYIALKSLTDVQTNTVMRMVTRSGSIVLQPCTVALNEAIRLQDGQINRVTVAFNGTNRLTRYAS